MPLTPETLTRHELVGLEVEVVAASNPDAVGISGRVVMETTQLLTIERDTRVWHVPKDSATFAFDVDCEAQSASNDVSSAERRSAEQSSGQSPRDSGDEPRTKTVRVEGERLVGRPARRTANAGDSKWR